MEAYAAIAALPIPDFVSHVSFKQVHVIPSDGLPKSAFHMQDDNAKETLLAGRAGDPDHSEPDPASTKQILSSLAQLSPATASLFAMKPSSLDPLAFRLYDERPVNTQKQSFIALSYNWPEKKAGEETVKPPPDKIIFPLSDAMRVAILEERTSEDEGFWYDQGCIDQENGEEKAVSIGMMDVIYRQARVVIVAIDDILLSKEEVAVLGKFKEHYDKACLLSAPLTVNWCLVNSVPPLLEIASQTIFQKLVEKLLRAKRFGRAWCSHEAYLARDLVFLVGCEPEGTDSPTFLRFTASFCYSIMQSTNLWHLGDEIPQLSREIIGICAKIGMRHATKLTSCLPSHLRPAPKQEVSKAREHLLATAVDVFGMYCGGNPDPTLSKELKKFSANMDKLSIALNTAEFGIMLKCLPRSEWSQFSEDSCYRTLLTLALAFGNAEALCTTGYTIVLESDTPPGDDQEREEIGLTVPPTFSCFSRTTTTSGSISVPKLDPSSDVSLKSRSGADYLELDLLLLRTISETSKPHHPRMPLHRPSYRGPVISEEDLSTLKPQLQYLATFLSGSVGTTPDTQEFPIHESLRNVTELDLKAAVGFYMKCSELQIKVLSDISNLIPAGSGLAKVYQSLTIEILAACIQLGPEWIVATSQCHGFSSHRHLKDSDLSPLFPSLVLDEGEESRKAATKLLEFVESLRREGLPWYAGGTSFAYWRVLVINDQNGTPALTFGPCFEDVTLAVPNCLLDGGYASLARCWSLLKTDRPDEFHIIGKSKLFAPQNFDLRAAGDRSPEEMRRSSVFGPRMGTWASLFDYMHKCAAFDLEAGAMIKKCTGLIDQCSKEARDRENASRG